MVPATRPRELRHWIFLAVFLGALGLFAIVARLVLDLPALSPGSGGGAAWFDDSVLRFFAAHRTPLLSRAAIDLTALGSVSVVLVLSLFVGSLLFAVGDRLGIAHLVVILAGAGLWPQLLKNIFGRARPTVVAHLVDVSDPSFPSGHVLGSSAVFLTLAFFASRHRRSLGFEIYFLVLAAFVIGLIGLSRLYLGVHYPTDVLGGFAFGTAWALLVAAAFHPLYRKAAGLR